MMANLLNLVLSILAGFIAQILWFMALVMGTGDSNSVTAYALYSSGVVFAAVAGFLLGQTRQPQPKIPPVAIGWLLIAPFSPVTMTLLNPAGGQSLWETMFLIALLVLFAVFGTTFTLIGARRRS